MAILKIAALLYLFIYFGILLLFRSYLLYKRTGINPIENMEKEGVAGFIEQVFKICLISIAVVVLNFVFLPVNYQWLIPIIYLENLTMGYVGIGLSTIGLAIGIIAQLQMGNSWRLGINRKERKERTQLIFHGFFKYSRNPIYLGILISNIGFFLMMPNALSFTFLVVSYFALGIKIRLEEQHLMKIHPVEYRAYLSNVNRWI